MDLPIYNSYIIFATKDLDFEKFKITYDQMKNDEYLNNIDLAENHIYTLTKVSIENILKVFEEVFKQHSDTIAQKGLIFIDFVINYINLNENEKNYYSFLLKSRSNFISYEQRKELVMNFDFTKCPDEFKKQIYSTQLQIANNELNFQKMEELLTIINSL